jgi:inosine/xanthosine triphosphatase
LLKVIVASLNPIKLDCTKQAFLKAFHNQDLNISGASLPSGVSDQPMSDEETFDGAHNRAENARNEYPNADFWVGIEGGLAPHNKELHAFAWVYILSETKAGYSKTATFLLPKAISNLIEQGIELGEADDIVFKRNNSKQKSGAVGILTHELIDRASYYEPAVILALIPFINSDLY